MVVTHLSKSKWKIKIKLKFRHCLTILLIPGERKKPKQTNKKNSTKRTATLNRSIFLALNPLMWVGLVVETLFLHLLKFRVLEWVSGYLGYLPVCSMQMLWLRWAVYLLRFQFTRLGQWNDPVQDELQWAAVAQCCVPADGVRLCLLPYHLYSWLYDCLLLMWCMLNSFFLSVCLLVWGFRVNPVDVLTSSTCGRIVFQHQ